MKFLLKPLAATILICSFTTTTVFAYTEAVGIKALTEAAEQGDVEAQYNLGAMYADGDGVEQNDAKAFEWFQKAANQGEASAQYNLAVMYDNGKGIEKDIKQAYYWYFKAAEQGDLDAQHHLRMSYLLKQLDQSAQKRYKMISKDWVIPVVDAEEASEADSEAD
ncbi:sel1 repeat family protein [Acinetobacter sp. C32I]|uniref:tetratricopeptide repeat protein n=1 Tax=Acinetobacter sp. C32I TaxID=2950074 RepID=UPI00203681B5|nr:tetratricopeptide repeat protein [Acinetobacter sp. C32I]USA54693.1 sel1 repeat family protein [Acinetobacter sp. C32I]